MDRQIDPADKKENLFKQFEYIDLMPYGIALVLLIGELYILFQYLKIVEMFGTWPPR